MRSKTSYFNPTLFKKNLARFWPLWGGVSALGALLPLYLLMALIENGLRSSAGKGLELTISYYSVLAYAVPIISLFYAALCALAVWHYLYNARSVGLFHSLPITRKGLFVTNLLSGLAMMLIPYAVVGGLCILISIPAGLFEPVGLLVTILGVLGESLFYFAAATLVIFITGNPFAFAALYFIFHFLAAGMEWLISQLMTQFYLGVEQAYTGVAEFLSPTVYLCRSLEIMPEYERIPMPDGWIENGDLLSVHMYKGWLIAAYAAVGLVLLGLAWALYQRRRSESAGEVVAVGWMKPVFRYGVALCAALTGGTLLYVMFSDFSYRATAQPVPFALCMAVAGLVGYYIASMLLAKSLKVFRGTGKGALATVLVSVALCFAIAADPAGVEDYVPDLEDLTDASINIYPSYARGLSVYTLDPALMQKLLDFHHTVVAEKDLLKDRGEPDWDANLYIDLHYWTPEDTVRRSYRLSAADAQSEAVQALFALATDPDIQENNLFDGVTPSDSNDILDARLVGGETGQIYNTVTQELETVDLTLEQAKALEAAVRRDVQAGHFGRTLLLTDYDEYRRSVYADDLYLNYNLTFQREDPNERNSSGARSDRGSRSVYFRISTYCTETLQALEDMGVLDGTHRLLTQMEMDSMERREDGTWAYSIYTGDSEAYSGGSIVYPGEARASTYEIG